MIEKKKATYSLLDDGYYIQIGQRAWVQVSEHHGGWYDQVVHTTVVTAYNEETGIFETLNTIYSPVKELILG